MSTLTYLDTAPPEPVHYLINLLTFEHRIPRADLESLYIEQLNALYQKTFEDALPFKFSMSIGDIYSLLGADEYEEGKKKFIDENKHKYIQIGGEDWDGEVYLRTDFIQFLRDLHIHLEKHGFDGFSKAKVPDTFSLEETKVFVKGFLEELENKEDLREKD